MNNHLVQAMADLDEETVLKLVYNELNGQEDPQEILAACRDGMTLVGQRYEAGEYYISELIMAAEIFKQVNALLPLGHTDQSGPSRGKIVFGTVEKDIHNIGKDIVISMLRAAGYDVTDLGVDVPAAKFVAAVNETGARIVGLSGLLTIAFDSMKAVVEALAVAGLRPAVKVMIGGGSLTKTVLNFTGADALGLDAQEAVNFANQWSSGQETA